MRLRPAVAMALAVLLALLAAPSGGADAMAAPQA